MAINITEAMGVGLYGFFVVFGFMIGCAAVFAISAIIAGIVGAFIKMGSGEDDEQP